MHGQRNLFTPTFEETLTDAVHAIGSWEAAAAVIWPAEDHFERARSLRAALTPDRREKLSPGELEVLIIEGARAGCLTPLARLLAKAGCKAPEPEPPEDAQAALATELRAALAQRERSDALIERAVETLERAGRPVRGIR